MSLRRRSASVVLGLLVALLVMAPAQAQQEPWVIEQFDVLIDVNADGTLQISEQITVNFRDSRRGIYREFPINYRLPYDSPLTLPDPELTPADYVRAYRVDDISVTSDTAPDDIAVTRPGSGEGWINIRIGEEDTWITGQHTYVIRYTVRGALNTFADHTELYWNAVGSSWDAPIGSATATVTGPGMLDTTCFQGPSGSDRLCDGTTRLGDGVRFTAGALPPYSGLTVVVGFDPSLVDAGDPILVERFSLERRLRGSEAAVPLAVLTTILAFGGIGALAYRQGRDRESVGDIAADGTVRGEARRRPLFSRLTVPVQFRPPDGLRPAQLGLIVDERVDPVDITATIVDLAVRGYLRIVESESKKMLFLTSTEHTLERLEEPADDQLNRYERQLFKALFADGDEVSLTDLRGTFHTEYVKVQNLIYEDGRSRRWWNASPQKTRNAWMGIGVGVGVLSIGLMFLLIQFTRVAISGVPLILASIVLIFLNRVMPHRTAKGSGVLRQTLGFKEFIVTAESGRMDFAEQQHLFLEYLPFAVVFGATDKWAKAFTDLGLDVSQQGFYVSTHGITSLDGLSRGLNTFSSAAGTGLATAPASSGGSGFSGGSSGGGGGGGGGGSW